MRTLPKLLSLTLLFWVASSGHAAGLFQRLAVAGVNLVISGGGTGNAKGICLDEARPAPPRGTNLPFHFGGNNSATVKKGGITMSLAEALNQGLVSLAADGDTNVTIENKSREPLEVRFSGDNILSTRNEPPDVDRIEAARQFGTPTTKKPFSNWFTASIWRRIWRKVWNIS